MPYAMIIHRFRCSFCPRTTDVEIPFYRGELLAPLPQLPDEPGTAGWTYINIGASDYLVCPKHKVNMAMAVDGGDSPPSRPGEEVWHLRKGQWISAPNDSFNRWH